MNEAKDTEVRTETIPVREYPAAPFGARVRAYLVDLLVAFLPLFLAMSLTVTGLEWTPIQTWVAYLLIGSTAIWAICYSLAKDGWSHGQGIGKNMYGLMVVNVDTGRPCSIRESILRQLDLFFLQMVPMIGWLIEPIAMLLSEDGRRLGDRASRTQVIEVPHFDVGPKS